MEFGKYFALAFFCLLISAAVFAIPGIPHQFYGYATVNQAMADGANIVAKINGEEVASTTTVSGNYGISPNIFYIPDPNGNRLGKPIEFFLNNSSVATFNFANGKTTRLDLFIGEEPSCGDGICNLDEDNESCPGDCVTGPVCGDGSCEGSEDCSSCAADCGDCPVVTPTTGGTSPGSGPAGSTGGSSLKLGVEVSGNCVGQETEVTILNTRGNPSPQATVSVVKDRKTVAEEKTAEDGKVSFTFDEPGEYMFRASRSGYTVSSKTVALKECVGGESGAGEERGGAAGEEGAGTVDLCEGVDCDDKNPCTADSCLVGKGYYCFYSNQPDGTACGAAGKCVKGVCEEPQAVEDSGAAAPAGLFGLGAMQAAGIGSVIAGLLAGLYLYSAGRKKKKK